MELWTAFLLGLVGSAHCAGMCGPLVLALPANERTRVSFLLGRVAYHLGRLATYCSLGVVFGFFGRTLLMAGLQRSLSITLGVLLIGGWLLSRKFAFWRPMSGIVAGVKCRMGALLHCGTFTSRAALGLLNGLLPCGLVYVAAAGATATGGMSSGATYMAVFGAGTLPMMLALSLSAHLVPFALRLKLRSLVPVSILGLGALLILRGLALGIPYLSPDLTAFDGGCCH